MHRTASHRFIYVRASSANLAIPPKDLRSGPYRSLGNHHLQQRVAVRSDDRGKAVEHERVLERLIGLPSATRLCVEAGSWLNSSRLPTFGKSNRLSGVSLERN